MKILLVQAISTHDCGELVFPLGLARLAAVIGPQHEVRGLDLNLNPFPWPEVVHTLVEFKPRVVAISFRNLDPLAGNLLSFVPHLKTLAKLVKNHAPQAAIILGGSAFTLFAARLMAEIPEIELALAGQAEATLPLLLERLESPASIPGVYWRSADGQVAHTPAIPSCRDVDSLPLPTWQIFDPQRYQQQNRYVAFMGVETKRGCSHQCRYCLYPTLQGRGVRLRDPRRVVDELAVLQHEHGIQAVHFTDPVVNQPTEHLRAVCREILNRRLQIGWTGFFREESLTETDLALYQESGLLTVYFSADGASDHALKLLGKNLSREQILRAARLAAGSGILSVYHFLVNLPGETQQSVDQTRTLLEDLYSLHLPRGNLGAVVVSNLRLYPGAPLTEEIIRNRLMDPRHDLLYPTYFNPPPWDHLRHELTALCMSMGVAGYLGNGGP